MISCHGHKRASLAAYWVFYGWLLGLPLGCLLGDMLGLPLGCELRLGSELGAGEMLGAAEILGVPLGTVDGLPLGSELG